MILGIFFLFSEGGGGKADYMAAQRVACVCVCVRAGLCEWLCEYWRCVHAPVHVLPQEAMKTEMAASGSNMCSLHSRTMEGGGQQHLLCWNTAHYGCLFLFGSGCIGVCVCLCVCVCVFTLDLAFCVSCNLQFGPNASRACLQMFFIIPE